MVIDFEKLRAILLENGMHPTRAKNMSDLIRQDMANWPELYADKQKREWAFERGFVPGCFGMYGNAFNEQTYKNYWSDFDYFMAYPLNNHFIIWINDKLTLKYMLNTPELSRYMPEYYLYIENDGHYTYLMDSPEHIKKDADYLLNLLKDKKILAFKPNRGSGGSGFSFLQYENGKLYRDRKQITMEEYEQFKSSINGYIVTEFIHQSDEMEKIYPTIASAFRIILYKKIQNDPYAEPDYGCLLGYARFATNKNRAASNNDQGGLAVTIDWENGVYKGGFRGLKEFWGDVDDVEEKGFERHPDTGVVLNGERIPNWDAVKKGLIDICRHMSSLDYFGMDVILTNDGFKICEINSSPSVGRGQHLYGKCCLDNEDAINFAKSKKRPCKKSFIECIREATIED